MKPSEWGQFFDGYASKYMEEPFTRGTRKEAEFLVEELRLPEGSSILDVGCGTGRHAVALAERGYRVTGVDISRGMLAEAAKAAAEAGVAVELLHADASRSLPEGPFDAAVCLCEGAFALIGSSDDPIEHDLAILRNVHAALGPGGRFILTTLNALRIVRSISQKDADSGRFDPLTMTEVSEANPAECGLGVGNVMRERYYVPTELTLLFRTAGFVVEWMGSGTAGGWERRAPRLDEFEIMVVARKPDEPSNGFPASGV